METVRRLLRSRYIAIALVTLVTLGIVSAVVLTTTSFGCSPSNAIGLKTTHCLKTSSVASLGHSSPTPTRPAAPTVPPANPPYNPGASAYPPYNPGASAGAPYENPASSGGPVPPMANPASPSGGPTLALSCRLPIYAGGPGSGGFIVFPGRTFVADPSSAVTAPTPPGATPPPSNGMGPGYPTGWYGLSYDAAYSKWLPVPWAWVSPDGSHYAYPINGDVYVQNVAAGTQLDLGVGQRYNVLKVENSGVYVTMPSQPGLWFLPFAGTARQITASGFWQAESSGEAYGTITSAVPQGATNTILKLDIASGTSTPFFSKDGAQSMVTGFDAQGHPVITAQFRDGAELFIATAPDTAQAIAVSGFGGYYQPFPYGPIADSHGTWFSVGGGIILLANGSWYAMSSLGGTLAGQCL